MTEKELFIQECNSLKNKAIKEVVLNTLNAVPLYFYEIPSSSSGKYHPEDEIKPGGLVRHTLKDVKVAKELANAYNMSSYDLELCIAALLLHDCCKSGKIINTGHTEFLHPQYAAEVILETNPLSRVAKKIAKLVKSHMGRWNVSPHYPNIKLIKPRTKLQKFVHLCDYIASRKAFDIIID